jgi:hypothetical protein
MSKHYSPTDGLVPTEGVLERYKRSKMWLTRIRGQDAKKPQLADPHFPEPSHVINGRLYWKFSDLLEWEARHATTSK